MSGARAWLVAASVAAGLAGGCRDGVSSPSGMGVPLGQEFTLAVGQVASVEGASLRLALRAVRNDSRCPVDVQCVWEGDATVFLDVAGSSATAAYELHTSGRFPRQASHGPYRITLVRLDPVPHAGSPPAAGDYRATLVVVR